MSDQGASSSPLARSEASFRALIENSPDGVVVHRKGIVVYTNPAMARLLGWDSERDMIGLPVLAYVHPDDQAQVLARIRSLHDGNASVPFNEERLVRRDGSWLTALITGMNVVFEGEACVAAVVRDVTSERRLQAQLAQADRMASVGVLAAGVAHEINNPLTYVMLRLDAIASLNTRLRRAVARVSDDVRSLLGEASAASVLAPLELSALDELDTHVATASEGAQRVRRIVQDLRVFSRPDDGRRTPTDVEHALDLAVSMATHEIRHRARVERAYGRVALVMASEGTLAQVFLNLLLNAAHATPAGAPDAHAIHLRTWSEGSSVLISVRDEGTGIPRENVSRLFEPFFTTKPVGEGSGLGLSICHGLVASLGGTIRVESREGQGSTFTVVLPAAEAGSARASRGGRTAVAQAGTGGRFLVVDDEPSLGEASAEALRAWGSVAVATNGADARALLQGNADFDVIVCDVVMPGLSGVELLAWIRANRPELAERVLFISGGRLTDEERAVVAADPSRFLDKPFDVETLRARVAGVMRATSPRRGR